MDNFQFEFHWWMVAVVAGVIALGILYRKTVEYLEAHPRLAHALKTGVIATLMFVSLGMLAAKTPAGTWDTCTEQPNQCLAYIGGHLLQGK